MKQIFKNVIILSQLVSGVDTLGKKALQLRDSLQQAVLGRVCGARLHPYQAAGPETMRKGAEQTEEAASRYIPPHISASRPCLDFPQGWTVTCKLKTLFSLICFRVMTFNSNKKANQNLANNHKDQIRTYACLYKDICLCV